MNGYDEDACQIYKDHEVENLSCLHHMRLSILQTEPTKFSLFGQKKQYTLDSLLMNCIRGQNCPLIQ